MPLAVPGRTKLWTFSGGEADDELLIKLPEQGVLVAQGLVHHDVHLYLGNNDITGWQQALDTLAAESGYDTVLAGHGLPTGPDVYEDVRRYLSLTLSGILEFRGAAAWPTGMLG